MATTAKKKERFSRPAFFLISAFIGVSVNLSMLAERTATSTLRVFSSSKKALLGK